MLFSTPRRLVQNGANIPSAKATAQSELTVDRPRYRTLACAIKLSLLCSTLTSVGYSVPALAQENTNTETSIVQADAAKQQYFEIAAGPLAEALTQFSGQAGIYLAGLSDLTQGMQTKGIKGTYTVDKALSILLDSTGFKAAHNNNGHYKIIQASEGDDVTTLSTMKVKANAQAENGYGPVGGFIALRSAAGTKTDAAITEVPRSISVVSSELIDAQGLSNLNQALRYTPGVFSEQEGVNHRYARVSARGFNNVKTYVDGMYTNLGGGFIMPEMYGLERVSAMRGPSSTLYGSGSLGGIIDLTTKRPTDEPLREVKVLVGNHEHREGRLDVSDRIGDNDDLRFRVTSTWRNSGTQIDHVDDDGVFFAPVINWTPSDQTSLTLMGYHQKESGGNINLTMPIMGSLQPHPLGQISNSTFYGNPETDFYEATTNSIAWEVDHHFNDSWSIKHRARYTEYEYEQQFLELMALMPDMFLFPMFIPEMVSAQYDPLPATVSLPAMFGGSAVTNAPSPWAGYIPIRTALRYPGGYYNEGDAITSDTHIMGEVMSSPAVRHNLLFGLDYAKNATEFSYLNPGDVNGIGGLLGLMDQFIPTDLFDPDYAISAGTPVFGDYRPQSEEQLGLYFQDRMTINDKLIVTFGVRHDIYDKFETRYDGNRQNPRVAADIHEKATTYQGGVNYLLDSGLVPYFSYAESFEPQTGEDYTGTPFDPITGTQYEAGMKYLSHDESIMASVAVFDLSKNNLAITDDKHFGCAGSPTSPCQKASGEVVSSGVELEVRANPIPELTVLASYSTNDVHVSIDDDTALIGKHLTNQPQKQASLWAMYQFEGGSLDGFGISGGARYMGSTYADAANTLEVPSYTLFDLGLYYQAQNGMTFSLNANNITDEQYQASCNTLTCSQGISRKITGTLSYRW